MHAVFSVVLNQSKILVHYSTSAGGMGDLLIDRMVELCDTLMSPVFTQLWKNLSQSIRPKRVEIGKGIRIQAYKAKYSPFSAEKH